MERSEQVEDRYPWYDSTWLAKFVRARDRIRRDRPDKLAEFVRTFDSLRTRSDFQVKEFSRIFDDATMENIKQIISTFQWSQLELHEIDAFGRFVVHDHPFIIEFQESLVDFASQAAGEPVERGYNFVSLYKKLGVCPVHMDAPSAKWTLDLCIAQSEPWPIHLSQVIPWPDDFASEGKDWEESIKRASTARFTSYSLEPGQALFFSGSSQWHYREPLPRDGKEHFCHLVFFHFVPKGMRTTLQPKNWARLFDIPELTDD